MQKIKAWAVVVKGTDLIPYTSAPPILGGGSIYQIYRNAYDAREFCKIPFDDATYTVHPVTVTFVESK